MRKKLKGRYPKNKKFEHQTSKIFFKKNYLKEWNMKVKHLRNYVWLTTKHDTPDTNSVTIIHHDGLSLEQRLI